MILFSSKVKGRDRWRPLQSCLAACWPWYITVSTASLNCGIGSSALNAEVKALDRLQIVRDLNSSYVGSKKRRTKNRSGIVRPILSPKGDRMGTHTRR